MLVSDPHTVEAWALDMGIMGIIFIMLLSGLGFGCKAHPIDTQKECLQAVLYCVRMERFSKSTRESQNTLSNTLRASLLGCAIHRIE